MGEKNIKDLKVPQGHKNKKTQGEVNDRAHRGGRGRRYNDPDERYDRFSSSRHNTDYNIQDDDSNMQGERGWGRTVRQETREMENMENSGISEGIRGGKANLQEFDNNRHMGVGHHGTSDDKDKDETQKDRD